MSEIAYPYSADQRVNKLIYDCISFVYPELEEGEKALLITNVKQQTAQDIAEIKARIIEGGNETIMRWVFSDMLFQKRLLADIESGEINPNI